MLTPSYFDASTEALRLMRALEGTGMGTTDPLGTTTFTKEQMESAVKVLFTNLKDSTAINPENLQNLQTRFPNIITKEVLDSAELTARRCLGRQVRQKEASVA